MSTTRWFYFRRSLGYALAGSAAAIVAVVALMVVSTPADEVTDVTATTATTVAPPTTAALNTVPPTPQTTIPTESPLPTAPVVAPPATNSESPADTVAPRIQILSPDTESRVKAPSIVVVGLTEPGAKITYPADRIIDVGVDGMWSTEVRLDTGENILAFTATDEAGNRATASVTVIRVVDPPRTTTTTKAPVEWTFTAHDTYGSWAENPPYDVYYGTGKPGTQITIISEYGGGTAEVGENGEWGLKVFFPEAPSEVTFPVNVKDFTGAKVVFEFVSLFVG